MKQYNIDKKSLSIFISDYSYTNTDTIFKSRCSEGNYSNSKNLPMLALPGGDIGELAVLYAAANSYGFKIHPEKTLKVLTDIVGGTDNLSFHGGFKHCHHLKYIHEEPSAYSLEPEDIATLQQHASLFPTESSEKTSTYQTAAILQVKGERGIYPQFTIDTDEQRITAQVFIVHQTFINQRHQALSQKLIEQKAVTLYNDLDADYLYQIISSTTDDHFFETARRLAGGLPIYEVKFEKEGSISIEERGKIS